VAIGVTQRLEPNQASNGLTPTRPGLLTKVASLTGDWQIVMHCESASYGEGLAATRQIRELAEEAAANLSTTRQITDTISQTTESPWWARIKTWLETIAAYLSQGEGSGMWTVDTWAIAANETQAGLVAGALHASISSDQGWWFATFDCPEPEPGDPPPTSALSSQDLGSLLAPPQAGQPGLAIRQAPPPARRPASGTTALRLGRCWGTSLEASIALSDLEGHAFVTGTTGSGKTTTLHRLLAELWNRQAVPFLVLDPVKDDYSAIAGAFKGGIQLVRGQDLHMNLLEPWPGQDRQTHLGQVANAFKGAFTMPSPTPYVVTQLFDQVAMLPGAGQGISLFDVRDMVPNLITSLGYAPEQESNIKAALMTRLNLLLAPTRAHRFSWTGSDQIKRLFTRPTVVTLGDLGDEEERSFVVILLAMTAWARARAGSAAGKAVGGGAGSAPGNGAGSQAGAGGPGVNHVLVLEEAHRILPEISPTSGDPETGSAKQVSAELLTAMLAEVRGYGQQIIVVDQSPSRVASDVARNTNLKLVHRVVHPADQDQMSGALGLGDDAARLLGELECGQVVLTTRSEPCAQTVEIERLKVTASPIVTDVPAGTASWPCDGTTERHYRAWKQAAQAAQPMAFYLAGLMFGEDDGDGKALWRRVYQGLLAVAGGDQTLTGCLAWAGIRHLTAERRSFGPVSGPFSADSQLTGLYQAWASHLPASKAEAESTLRLAPRMNAMASIERYTWEERAVAAALAAAEPRNGLGMLGWASWRAALPEVRDRLKTLQQEWEPWFGSGVKNLLHLLTEWMTWRARLSPDIGQKLLKQAGL
jgi:hypothetical protein